MVLSSSIAMGDYTARVDPSIQFQPFEGWGTSLAWWAHVVGGFPEPIRSEYMDLAFDPVKGLGLNVVRYNIGGGENPLYSAPNKQFLSYRAAIPGYEPSPSVWDWNADAKQRWTLNAAVERGANQLEAFSNSPPYWMTISGSVTGNKQGANNLKESAFGDFSNYLTEVVKHFHDTWGITFRSLEPLNEPSGGWSFGNGQEGCHFSRPAQVRIIKETGAALEHDGVKTPVTASDESFIDDAVRTCWYYDPTILNELKKINTHSYGGSTRTQLANYASSAGKELWLSEYGDGDASGLSMSRRILEDMRYLHPSAWVYWQVVDSVGGWGFLKNPLQNDTNTEFTFNKKYYVMANYSKFIRPGYQQIAINDPNSLAAWDRKSQTLVIVTTNSNGSAEDITFDLSRFPSIGKSVTCYRTSASEDTAKQPDIPVTGKKFRMNTPPESVTTYIIKGASFSGKMGFDPTGFYRIISSQNGYALSADGNGLSDATGVNCSRFASKDTTQQWGLIGQGDDVYKFVNRHSGLTMETLHDSSEDNAAIDLYHDKYETPGSSNQQWKIIPLGSGRYRIINTKSGLSLENDIPTNTPSQSKFTGSKNQQWVIEQVR
jgi:O-glycosyl hydrolase